MKLYKNTITYEIETVTSSKLDSTDLARIKENFENCFSEYRTVKTNGKVVIGTKEIEV